MARNKKLTDQFDELADIYIELFPAETDIPLSLSRSVGLSKSISVLKIAIARGKRIGTTNGSGDDQVGFYITGENLNLDE